MIRIQYPIVELMSISCRWIAGNRVHLAGSLGSTYISIKHRKVPTIPYQGVGRR